MLGQTAVVTSGSTCVPTLPCSRNAIQGLDSETYGSLWVATSLSSGGQIELTGRKVARPWHCCVPRRRGRL